MTAKELGWKWLAWQTFLSRDGLKVDVRTTCPMDVAAMAKKDAEAATWEKWVQADERRAVFAPGPLIEPVERWFRRPRRGKGAPAAAQAVAAGLWPQERCQKRWIANSPFCLECLKLGKYLVGDARHRMAECPSYSVERREVVGNLEAPGRHLGR